MRVITMIVIVSILLVISIIDFKIKIIQIGRASCRERV